MTNAGNFCKFHKNAKEKINVGTYQLSVGGL